MFGLLDRGAPMNPISTASAGLMSGLARFDSASTALTKAFDGQSTADPASAIVDQITAGEQMQASAATIRASDRMLKQLLDIKV
jgi:flagellar hook protein FlgE